MRGRRQLGGLLALLATAACTGPTARQAVLGDLDEDEPVLLELSLTERPAEGLRAPLLGPPPVPFHRLVGALDEAAGHPAVRGLLVRGGPWRGGFAQATEVARRLRAVHEAGRPVYCQFDAADEPAYLWMAAGCDRLFAPRAAILDVRGLALHTLYFGKALRDAGIDAEIFQYGEAKGAADPFVSEHMPEPVRHSLQQLLDDLLAERTRAIVAARGKDRPALADALQDGPWDGAEAQARGLVDAIAFDDAARERLRRATKVRTVRKVSLRPGTEGLADVLQALVGETSPPVSGCHVAVLHLAGTITDGDRPEAGVIAAGPTVRALRHLADEHDVAAVVVRIDSPGGSALASERIWHAMRRVARRKPLAVSVGDMAASGGYYVSVAARRIFAEPTSIVGSIGVVGGKVSLERLVERFGIRVETVEAGRHAGWSSPLRPFTPSERARLRKLMGRTYRLFLRRVSEGRKLEGEALQRAAAQARLWSGRRALTVGLVDALGGLDEAIAWARKQGGLPQDAPVEHLPARPGLLQLLGGEEGLADQRAARLAPSLAAPLGQALRFARVLAREGVALHLPYLLAFE